MEMPKEWKSANEAILESTRFILNEYLLSLKLANKSPATLSKYRWILERFLSENTIPLSQLTPNSLLEWLQKFSEGKKPRSIILYHSCLSSFFNFCLAEDYMDTVVMKKRWRPKVPDSLPKYLNEHEFSRVKATSEQLSLRNRALFLFFSTSGCRISEVSQLNIEDIDLEDRTTTVIGKGRKIRQVHFSEECALVLKEYLRIRSGDHSQALFINCRGGRLTCSGIYEVVRKLGKAAGLPSSLHPHKLRHTFATNLMSKGAELEFIADELGHSNLNTTRIYARIPTENVILAYENMMG